MTSVFSILADLLMIAASLGAAAYCLILSRRLSRLTSFDKGIGGAIAVLSAQVDEMKTALSEAKSGSDGAGTHLQQLVAQAREISGELELMIASCHDFAEEALIMQGNGSDEMERPSEDAGFDRQTNDLRAVDAPDADLSDAIPIFGSRRKSSGTSFKGTSLHVSA